MLSSDNNDLKSNFKTFKKISSKENYTDSQKNKIISISNRMLKRDIRRLHILIILFYALLHYTIIQYQMTNFLIGLGCFNTC